MFNMDSIGKKISSARRARNMTQMDLADRLHISFQAISNWERGQSMPDIAKLPELSKQLDISIDELLGNASPLIHGLTSDAPDEYLKTAPITPEEVIEAAPILKPSQFKEAFQNSQPPIDLAEIDALFPYLDDDTLDQLAQRVYASDGIAGIVPLVTYLSDDTIGALAMDAIRQADISTVDPIAPFLSEQLLHRLVRECYLDANPPRALSELLPLLPHLEEDDIDALAQMYYAAGEIDSVSPFLPHMSEAALDQLAADCLLNHGVQTASPFFPFVSEGFLKSYLQKYDL